jgi:hypothetical protein
MGSNNQDHRRLFTSWQEEFGGPHSFDGDNFTTTQRYDFTNTFFDYTAVDDPNKNFTIFGFGTNPALVEAAPAYAAKDIIIVSLGAHPQQVTNIPISLLMESVTHLMPSSSK